jgi:acid phosphatase type 7
MTEDISRRELLRAATRAAGGVTFLALVPTGWRRFPFALPPARTREQHQRPLLFTALPYIQPGPAGVLVPGQESLVVAWQTEDRAADFAIEYGPSVSYGHQATVAMATRDAGGGPSGGGRRNYSATITGLALATRYHYRVRESGRSVVEGFLTTRRPRGAATRFVSFGDNAYGDPGQRAIAWYAHQMRPDFVMNTGDNVYEGGLDTEYAKYFFPIYNADVGGPRTGAPLLRSVPFYTVLGNHDVHTPDANGQPAADFDKSPDALAYYSSMYLPLTGPEAPPQPTPVIAAGEGAAAFAKFRECAGPRFPRMGNYSFDYGDVHFLCLDSNVYVDPTDAGWHDYIARDLSGTDARWKVVVYHHPAFNAGDKHYKHQHMRVLSPLFERQGVDLVLSGHEHVYQRTRPFTFVPSGPGHAAARGKSDRLVPGTFTIDHDFDGVTKTVPRGIVYITTGAGGKELYDPGFTSDPARWLHEEDDHAAYTARMVTDVHSFTVIEVDAERLQLRQIDETGHEVDRIVITKPA